jgi:hypothetical protein
MTVFQNLILFTNHYENLQEMLETASFLKYVDLYLTNEWGSFYVGRLYVIITEHCERRFIYFSLLYPLKYINRTYALPVIVINQLYTRQPF